MLPPDHVLASSRLTASPSLRLLTTLKNGPTSSSSCSRVSVAISRKLSTASFGYPTSVCACVCTIVGLLSYLDCVCRQVLDEFVKIVDNRQLDELVPVLVPELYRIAAEEGVRINSVFYFGCGKAVGSFSVLFA